MAKSKYSKFVAASASAALVATAVAPVASLAASFKDVPSSSDYYNAVNELSNKGVIEGYPDGTFKIRNKVTRAEAAKMLAEIRGFKSSVAAPFKDVVKGSWYEPAVNALYAEGLLKGRESGDFEPKGQLSRAEFAKLVVEAYDLPMVKADDVKLPFTDLKNSKGEDNWAIDYIRTLYAYEFINGKTVTTFAPTASIDRGDMALLLNRVENGYKDLQVAESVKAINATTVEVTYKEAKHDVKAGDFKIEGLEVKNAVVKQTDSKTVVLTTSTQTGDKEYTVFEGASKLGSFKGISAVIPTKVDVETSSLQGVIGKDVTLTARVTVPEGQSKAGIPVTFNIVNSNPNTNDKIEKEVTTDENGVATYSYTRYYGSEDNVTAYATEKSSVYSQGKVYWANNVQLTIDELTSGNALANNTKKTYKVTGKANTTYYVAIKENLNVAPDKITNVQVQSHGANDFVTPYELTTGSSKFATVVTDSKGEASFTLTGTNLTATPIVYLPSSVSATDNSYSKLALQAQAPTVTFSQVDKLAIAVKAEGTADSAEYLTTPVAYDGNSTGGRTYTVTVTDKDGKIAPEGTVAYVAFEDGNIKGDVYFSTGTANFQKVAAGDVKPITVGKEGKASFRVAGKGATTFVKPTVFLNTAGKTSPVELDKTDVQIVAEITYFKAPVVRNATLKVTDLYGRTISSLEAGQDAYFVYQSVDQNGFEYRPNGYNTTGQTTQVIWKPVTQPDGSIVFVQETVTLPGNTVYEYNLAFDVTSTFGDATVKDAAGNVLKETQNLGNTKTYQVKSDATGKAIVRVTSTHTDTVSVNVTGASNILPTQTASVSFTSSATVPAIYTGAVESYDSVKQTLKFAGKNPISYVGNNVSYRNINNQPIATADDFIAELKKAQGTVTVTYENKNGVATFYIMSVASTGTAPVETGDTVNLTPKTVTKAATVGGEAIKVTASELATSNKNLGLNLTGTATSSNSSVATATVTNNELVITPVAAGETTVTVNVTDGTRNVTGTVKVTVTEAGGVMTFGSIKNGSIKESITKDKVVGFSEGDLTETGTKYAIEINGTRYDFVANPFAAGRYTVTVPATVSEADINSAKFIVE